MADLDASTVLGLLHSVGAGRASERKSVSGSYDSGEFGERDRDAPMRSGVPSEFVVAAPEVLHECMTALIIAAALRLAVLQPPGHRSHPILSFTALPAPRANGRPWLRKARLTEPTGLLRPALHFGPRPNEPHPQLENWCREVAMPTTPVMHDARADT